MMMDFYLSILMLQLIALAVVLTVMLVIGFRQPAHIDIRKDVQKEALQHKRHLL